MSVSDLLDYIERQEQEQVLRDPSQSLVEMKEENCPKTELEVVSCITKEALSRYEIITGADKVQMRPKMTDECIGRWIIDIAESKLSSHHEETTEIDKSEDEENDFLKITTNEESCITKETLSKHDIITESDKIPIRVYNDEYIARWNDETTSLMSEYSNDMPFPYLFVPIEMRFAYDADAHRRRHTEERTGLKSVINTRSSSLPATKDQNRSTLFKSQAKKKPQTLLRKALLQAASQYPNETNISILSPHL